MESTLEEYNNLYEAYMKNPGVKPTYEKLYNTCISILLHENTCVEKKEEVLSKLIFICPEDTQLYYYMGCILKDNPIKSSLWFRLCMQHCKNPNIENFLDLTKYLFDNSYNKYIKYIIELYPEYLCTPYIKDPRIQDIQLCIHTRSKHIENIDSYIHRQFSEFVCLLRNSSSEQLVLQYYNFSESSKKVGENTNYQIINNIGYCYKTLYGYIKESLLLSNPFIIRNEDTKEKKRAFSSFLLLWNYIYSEKCLYIDNYIPSEHDLIQHNLQYKYFCFQNNLNYTQSRHFTFHNTISKGLTPFTNKIKIGYISDGFVHNVISNFIIPIINHHNREQFEIHLFSFNESKCTLLKHIPYIHIHLLTKNPTQNANLIYNLHIDILIDLDSYTGVAFDTLSKNPSPIQMTYIGFPNSSGLDFIHYRITDHNADHPESSQHNKEKLLKLPGCFLLYQSILQTEFVDNYDYNKTSITLCAINNEIKHSTTLLYTWKSILEKNPTCKLLIKINSKDGVKIKTDYYTKKLDVDKSRLIIVPYSDNSCYFQIFQTTDIVLDTFPYSGTTTTCNALFNSCPVVTMYNKHLHCHNVSSSILMHCGLNELVTFSMEEYVNKVTYLCNNMEIIREYKRTLHQKFVTAMDPEKFMVGYENALIELYNKI
jgi:hypothetical protein